MNVITCMCMCYVLISASPWSHKVLTLLESMQQNKKRSDSDAFTSVAPRGWVIPYTCADDQFHGAERGDGLSYSISYT